MRHAMRSDAEVTCESSAVDEHLATSPVQIERRPYSAPRLRYLGSVRELTLGSGSNISDAARTLRP